MHNIYFLKCVYSSVDLNSNRPRLICIMICDRGRIDKPTVKSNAKCDSFGNFINNFFRHDFMNSFMMQIVIIFKCLFFSANLTF